MRILVPLDGSPQAEYAIGPAAQLARHAMPPTTLILARVETMVPMIISPASMGVPISPEPVTDREECERYLADLALQPTLASIAVEKRVIAGPVATAICEQAQALRIDLIMITSHGRAGIARAALGSVAEAVVQRSHVPTMILRLDAVAFAERPPQDHFTILVPLDGSPLAEASVPVASMMARALHGKLLLLQVVSPLPEHLDDAREPARDAKTYLTTMQQRLTQTGISVTYAVAWGDPATEIGAAARAEDCAIIAIATHGRTGWAKMVMGSVATAVLRQNHQPMIIVNPQR